MTMTDLKQGSCIPCREGAPTLTAAETAVLLRQVPAWRIAEVGGVPRLQREFAFKDFRTAMEFALQVGELAEREQHHPEIHLGWGKVMVESWTHKIRGLHQNDFILAAKIDAIHGG
jgi:4a-hydroxytetrahydrobiopterin dehydratase